MVDLLEQPYLDNLGIEALKEATCRLIKQMVEAWGETHITHNMVMLYYLWSNTIFFVLCTNFW